MKRMVAALVGGFTLAMAGTASAQSATESQEKFDECVGLACSVLGSPDFVPGAAAPKAKVAGPRLLEQQREPGFYEFGETVTGKKFVAFVVPQGRIADAPASIQNLPVVQAIADGSGDFNKATVVIFGPRLSLTAPGMSTVATTASNRARPIARAAADAYGCDYYYACIYEDRDFRGRKLQFADPGSNQLSRYGFNDAADSIRNRRNLDTLLYENWDGNSGSGDRYCYDSQTVHSSLGGFGDDASTLTNSSSDTYWC
jgi:hypothetical protein